MSAILTTGRRVKAIRWACTVVAAVTAAACSHDVLRQTSPGEPTGVNVDNEPEPSVGCTSHAGRQCFEGNAHWVDSCGNREELAEACTAEERIVEGAWSCASDTTRERVVTRTVTACSDGACTALSDEQIETATCAAGAACIVDHCSSFGLDDGTTVFVDDRDATAWDGATNCCQRGGRDYGCNWYNLYRIFPWRIGNRSFLFFAYFEGLKMIEVTNPLAPVDYAGLHLPHVNTPDTDEIMQDFAVIDDYPFGIAMQQHYGWTTVKLDMEAFPSRTTMRVVDTWLTPNNVYPSLMPTRAVLFRAEGSLHAAGHVMHTVRFDDPEAYPAEALPPVSDAWPSDYFKGRLVRLVHGTRSYVMEIGTQVSFRDASNPASTVAVGPTLPAAGNVRRFAWDAGNKRLVVLREVWVNVMTTLVDLVLYGIDDPESPTTLATVELSEQQLAHGVQALALRDELLVVLDAQGEVATYSLVDPTAPALLHLWPLPDLSTSVCSVLYTREAHLERAGNDYVLYRAAGYVATMTKILGP